MSTWKGKFFLLEPRNTHQSWNLTRCDVYGRTCHKSAHSRRGNELYYPTKPQQPNAKYYETTDESYSGSYSLWLELARMFVVDMFNDLRYRDRHYSYLTNVYVLLRLKELYDMLSSTNHLATGVYLNTYTIDENSNKCIIETVLSR